MLFGDMIAVYSEKHMEHINTSCGQTAELLVITVGGTYSYHMVSFKG
jgi:hypothetical protein